MVSKIVLGSILVIGILGICLGGYAIYDKLTEKSEPEVYYWDNLTPSEKSDLLKRMVENDREEAYTSDEDYEVVMKDGRVISKVYYNVGKDGKYEYYDSITKSWYVFDKTDILRVTFK